MMSRSPIQAFTGFGPRTTVFTFVVPCQRVLKKCPVSANGLDLRCFGVCLGPKAIIQLHPSPQQRFLSENRGVRIDPQE